MRDALKQGKQFVNISETWASVVFNVGRPFNPNWYRLTTTIAPYQIPIRLSASNWMR